MTSDVRATARCLELSPANSSWTLYPTSEPEAMFHFPVRPVALGDPAAVLGVELLSPSVAGEVRRPEKK